MANPIDYETRDVTIKSVTLIELEGEVRLVFPPVPRWVQIGSIAFTAFYALLAVIAFSAISWSLVTLNRRWLPSTVPSGGMNPHIFQVVWPWVVSISGAAIVLIYEIIEFQRWGHLPDVLAVRGKQLVWTRHWYWGMRDFRLPAEQVTAVTVRKVPDLFRRNHVFELIIKFKARRRFKRRFSTRETDMPSRIENALKAVLTPRDPS